MNFQSLGSFLDFLEFFKSSRTAHHLASQGHQNGAHARAVHPAHMGRLGSRRKLVDDVLERRLWHGSGVEVAAVHQQKQTWSQSKLWSTAKTSDKEAGS